MRPDSSTGQHLQTDPAPKELAKLDGLILKVAQRCNLACSYCYMYEHIDQSYKLKPPVMNDQVLQATIDRLKDYLDMIPNRQISITFHGGEPTLIGIKRFSRYAISLREALGDRLAALHIQTNGTLVDDAWIALFRELRVDVGISIDGEAEDHDRVRFDHFGRGSHSAVARSIKRLLEADISPSIIAVVNPAASGAKTYAHFRKLGIEKIDFLLPDATHDTKEKFFPQYRVGRCANYLTSAFDAWLKEDNPAVNVRTFKEVIKLILGGGSGTEAIGNPIINYLVIDTDGNIQGNDSLRVCRPRMCETNLNVLNDGFDDLARGAPLLYNVLREPLTLCETCLRCPQVDVCGGGQMPHRYAEETGFLNPSAWCEDLFIFVQHVRQTLGAFGHDAEKVTCSP
jgi:uncharacterized protein